MSGGVKEASAEYRSGELLDACPQGYKRTEVGVIPVDWNVSTIGDISDVKTGPFGSALHEKDYVIDGTPIITVEHLGERGVTYQNLPMVSDADRKRLGAYGLGIGDIVFSRVGSIDRNALIGEHEDGWLFSGRLLRVRVNAGSTVPKYLSYHFHSIPFKKRVAEVAVGQTMPSLNTSILKGVKVALPATEKEQTAIAIALSDVDTLITSLETLITKKRAIKTAAMQQLLTGKKRLPPYDKTHTGYKQTELGEIPEGWEVKKLENMSDFITKGATPTTYGFKWEKFGVPFLRSECVSENGLDMSESMFISNEANRVLRRSEVRPGDILITITGNVGRAIYLNDDFGEGNINQHIARVRVAADNVCPQYVFHYLSQQKIRKHFNTITTGQAYPQISLSQVRNAEVLLPTLREQRSIAMTLTDMASEIEVLEARLTKTQHIKQGMMQELLTGKTRLV